MLTINNYKLRPDNNDWSNATVLRISIILIRGPLSDRIVGTINVIVMLSTIRPLNQYTNTCFIKPYNMRIGV